MASNVPIGTGRTCVTDSSSHLERLVALNASAAFNRLAHFEVITAGDGTAEIEMRWSDDLTQGILVAERQRKVATSATSMPA